MNLATTLDILANRKLHKRINFRGLNISIENRKGSIRKGVDKNGKLWQTKMTFDYGYLKMTEGVDGDHVDCFVGPDENAKFVYVIHRQDPDTKSYDEDKVMLGFSSSKAAVKAFNENYDKPGNFGGMDIIPFDKFKEKVLATKDKPQKIVAGVK